jgi:hypothetical protein
LLTKEKRECCEVNDYSDWYSRIPENEHRVMDAAARWLRPIPWQWFITLTFPWNVRDQTADRKFKELINFLEKSLGTSVCFVAGKESKPKVDGINVPWHFHVLMASHASIPSSAIEYFWKRLVGSGHLREIDGKIESESIMVEPYNENERGPEYCLKTMCDLRADWLFRRLELFIPNFGGPSKPNHRTFRAARRAKEQQARFEPSRRLAAALLRDAA